MRHRKPPVSLEMREEWKDEYRKLSGEIHAALVNEEQVPQEKSNRLKALGQRLRSQSGD